jgi:8-oxo-dGTP pyrophosphatase MutT (NUDIX family)
VVLDAAALRERFAGRTLPAVSIYGDDDAGRLAAAVTPASVLVPIVTHGAGLTVLFTQRTAHLRAHSGQVSFPGGRAEPGDASPEFTALRETQEEIGLAPERIEVLARMPEYLTRIGLVPPPLELVPDPREVEEVFEVPLAFLLDPANHQRETRDLAGRNVGFWVMQYDRHRIWGATAGMLVNLYRMLA